MHGRIAGELSQGKTLRQKEKRAEISPQTVPQREVASRFYDNQESITNTPDG
jgi:hypothetical protein